MAVTSLEPVPASAPTRSTALAVLVAVVAFGLRGPSLGLDVALGAAALLPLLWAARARLGVGGQVLMTVLLVALGIVATTSLFPPPVPLPVGMLRPAWSTLGACLLLVAIGRLYVQAPAGGHSLTLGVALFALAAAGGTLTGPSYPVLCAAFLGAAAFGRRQADLASAPWSALSRRWVLTVGLMVACAVACAVGARIALPEANSWVLAQIMRGARDRTGFSTRLWLGSLHDLALSDEVVMRVRGTATDYLRGVVLTRYDVGARGQPGRWSARSDESESRSVLPQSPLGEGPTTQVELVEDEPERYFVPLEAVDVALPSGLANVDGEGVLSPVAAQPSGHYWFRVVPGRSRDLGTPDAHDDQLPPALVPTLRGFALGWAAEATSDRSKLEAIERHLRTEYQYSLEFERSSQGDPVVEFLLQRGRGHCEYFATAMVLLSRASGIPARLVGGYRVTEYNELGGYYLVRQRNAHTWVEAWVQGEGWSRFDPTPPDELALGMPSATPLLSAVGDLLRSWWAAVLRWLDRQSPLEIGSVLLLLVTAVLIVRWVRVFRQRRRADARASEAAPLPCFEALVEALGGCGIVRAAHEPVEALARRARESKLPGPAAVEAAELVLRYAALRYGGRGEPSGLAVDVARFVERCRASST